ncbi:MAG TPA: DUF4012 domain-containing protein [Candidatus Dojkabacteria bacterium]|nr:DUF4012 domain-containing protein [Candidatus Dojkabacteria bacterium]
MNNLRFNKVKSSTPISIIVHGGNRMGYLTAKTLVEQGGYVVIIDKFNTDTKKYISELKKSDLVDFFDFKGFESLFKNIKRFDYLYYMLEDKLKENEFESKDFLLETKYLELSLTQVKKNNAKFSLLTSLALNRELAKRTNSDYLSKPSAYSNIELQKYCETMVAEFKDKTDINARIVRIGTLIGSGVEKVEDESIHNLITEATQSSQITIKGDGLDIHNLIQEDDAIYGLLKLTFSNNTKGEVISLANKNDYTTLSIAYKLLELNTEAQSIRFEDDPDEKYLIQDIYVPAPHASKYGWNPQMTLEKALIEQIQVYYDNINKSWDISSTQEKESKKTTTKVTKTKLGEFIHKLTEPIRKIKIHRGNSRLSKKGILKSIITSVLIAAFSYFVIYPILGTVIGLSVINSSIKLLSQNVFNSNTDSNNQQISKIENNLTRISGSFENMGWMFSVFGKKSLYNDFSKVLTASQQSVQGGKLLLEATYPLSMYIKDFKPAITFDESVPSTTREYRDYLEKIGENRYKLEEASYRITLANEILKKIDINSFPKITQEKVIKIKELSKTAESATNTYKETTAFLPEILGVTERQRYLVLLQNESEIRSTGGWITSYGIVGIEGGQIRELFVDDIYNADGTLRVQGKRYSPPESMSKALGIDEWSFSLVNWSPDLAETRIASEQFVSDLGKGNDLDGVITIDITFFQKLLDKWGGVEVPGEDEIITGQNIYEKVFQMHREFTPGSTQKTTFLANLANEIIKKFLSMDIGQFVEIGDVLLSSLDEKHLQVSFKNNSAYNFFNNRNWAGSLDNKYNDAPISIDWNWGGNKANQYLNKNLALNISIKDEETIDFAYTLTVENSSTNNVYPQGDYINYQRIFIPSEAQILKVVGFDKNKFSTYKESGLKVIGGWFNIPVKEVATLEISYRLKRTDSGSQFPLTKQDGTTFLDLNIFKQAGERKHAYKLDIAYPPSWVLTNPAGLNTISNQLSSRFELNKDMEYKIVWNTPN